MDDKKTIEEIVISGMCLSDFPHDEASMKYGARKMADIKNSQIKELRDKCIERFNTYHDKHLNESIQKQMLGAVFALDSLLEEDSRDKLHCAFATLD